MNLARPCLRLSVPISAGGYTLNATVFLSKGKSMAALAVHETVEVCSRLGVGWQLWALAKETRKLDNAVIWLS
jgi:hypothetical protein